MYEAGTKRVLLINLGVKQYVLLQYGGSKLAGLLVRRWRCRVSFLVILGQLRSELHLSSSYRYRKQLVSRSILNRVAAKIR